MLRESCIRWGVFQVWSHASILKAIFSWLVDPRFLIRRSVARKSIVQILHPRFPLYFSKRFLWRQHGRSKILQPWLWGRSLCRRHDQWQLRPRPWLAHGLAIPLKLFVGVDSFSPVAAGNRWAFQAIRQERNDPTGNRRVWSTLFPLLEESPNVHEPDSFGFLEFVV